MLLLLLIYVFNQAPPFSFSDWIVLMWRKFLIPPISGFQMMLSLVTTTSPSTKLYSKKISKWWFNGNGFIWSLINYLKCNRFAPSQFSNRSLECHEKHPHIGVHLFLFVPWDWRWIALRPRKTRVNRVGNIWLLGSPQSCHWRDKAGCHTKLERMSCWSDAESLLSLFQLTDQ